MLVQALLALTFKPLMPAGGGMGPHAMGPQPDNPQNQTGTTGPAGSKWSRFLTGVRKSFNLRVFYIMTYRVWACGVATAVFGYFVPYIHLVRVYVCTPDFFFQTHLCLSILVSSVTVCEFISVLAVMMQAVLQTGHIYSNTHEKDPTKSNLFFFHRNTWTLAFCFCFEILEPKLWSEGGTHKKTIQQ